MAEVVVLRVDRVVPLPVDVKAEPTADKAVPAGRAESVLAVPSSAVSTLDAGVGVQPLGCSEAGQYLTPPQSEVL